MELFQWSNINRISSTLYSLDLIIIIIKKKKIMT